MGNFRHEHFEEWKEWLESLINLTAIGTPLGSDVPVFKIEYVKDEDPFAPARG